MGLAFAIASIRNGFCLALAVGAAVAFADSGPTTHTYSGDSPEAQAMHRRLMQDQANQQQFQAQQDRKTLLDERAKLQAELNDIDERLGHGSALSAKDKSALVARRAQVKTQIENDDKKIK